MIEALTVALYGAFSTRREQHVFSQALHGLVRLAKTEQILEIKRDADRAAGVAAGAGCRRQARVIMRKAGTACHARHAELQEQKA